MQQKKSMMSKKVKLLDMISNIDGASRDQILEEMRPEALGIAEQMLGEANEMADVALKTRYRWAQSLKMLEEQREQYGYRSAEQFAQILASVGQDPYTYISVATYISEQMFSEVVEFNRQATTRDWRITWDHLGILARHGDCEPRLALLTSCMDERLSVQQLRDLSNAMAPPLRGVARKKSR